MTLSLKFTNCQSLPEGLVLPVMSSKSVYGESSLKIFLTEDTVAVAISLLPELLLN